MLTTSRTTSFIASRVFLNAGLSLHFPATGHDDLLFMECQDIHVRSIAHYSKIFVQIEPFGYAKR